jgi:hypothetical protein
MDAMMQRRDVMPRNVVEAMCAADDPGIMDDLRRRSYSPYVQRMMAEEKAKKSEG